MRSWRLLVPDPVAVKFLEDGDSVRVVEPQQDLIGFELYIVEQWVCSRTNLTTAITTYTGQPQHKIKVAILEISDTDVGHPPRVESYLQSLASNHARQQDTRSGMVMVTNLSVFPSTLTILSIPEGDIRKYRIRFFLNENLKRLGCSGRAGISLTEPTEATLARFYMLYQTSDRIPPTDAVIDLVQLCQITLSMFTKLRPEFCDGLFCDLTHTGLIDWWTEVGSQYYNIEPSDGSLDPTTIAALLGLFLGARNRLNASGAPVPKNAFDIHALKRGIAHFQKVQKLKKTRRLDHLTLRRIHKVTAKAAHHEGWIVPRAVKSTVAELGKGGEMVIGMVGAKDKFGIADVETTDYNLFLKRLYGEHCKWLWRGKRKKPNLRNFPATSETPSIITGDANSLSNESSSSEDDTERKHLHGRDGPRLIESTYSGAYSSVDGDLLQSSKTPLHIRAGAIDHDNGVATADFGLGMSKSWIDASEPIASDYEGPPGNIPQQPETMNIHHNPQQPLATSAKFSGPIYTDSLRSESLTRESHIGERRVPLTSMASLSVDSRNRFDERPLKSRRLPDYYTDPVKEYFDEKGQIQFSKQKHILKRSKSIEINHRSFSEPFESTLDVLEYVKQDLPESHDKQPLKSFDEYSESKPNLDEDTDFLRAKKLHNQAFAIREKNQHLKDLQLTNNTIIAHDFKLLKDHMHSVCQDKNQQVDSDLKLTEESMREGRETLLERIREIEAREAKLEYELGVLSSKIEDVVEGVANLDRQVSEIESRGRALDADSRDHTWENWIETLVRRIGLV